MPNDFPGYGFRRVKNMKIDNAEIKTLIGSEWINSDNLCELLEKFSVRMLRADRALASLEYDRARRILRGLEDD